nr:uncharacterized protein LOC104115868 [Nicotiana tomentosiformis]
MAQENVLGAMFDEVGDIASRLELVRSLEHKEREAEMPLGSSSGYQVQQLHQRWACFECGDLSHFKRDHPRLLSGVPHQISRPMILEPTATPPAQPTRSGSSSGYQVQQLHQRWACFECGDLSHFKRDCPRLFSGVPQ